MLAKVTTNFLAKDDAPRHIAAAMRMAVYVGLWDAPPRKK
jgi:hypothetical protein